MPTIAPPSFQSLLIQMRFDDEPLSIGTAFVVISSSGHVLITNRHNVTGRHQELNHPLSQTGGIPNEMIVMHNRSGNVGKWLPKTEKLLSDSGTPLWREHPTLGAQADFVALPLTQLDDVAVYPYDLGNTGPDILVGPADSLSVVGFPFGMQAGGSLAIWATGFMASEPEISQNNMPIFYIDCRSRPGQSGSAVIAYRSGGSVAIKGGGTSIFSGPVTKFLGIYSGRVNEQSDIGIVWRADAIKQLVDTL